MLGRCERYVAGLVFLIAAPYGGEARDLKQGYYRVTQPVEIRLLRGESAVPDSSEWERRDLPGGSPGFLSKQAVFTAQDIEWISLVPADAGDYIVGSVSFVPSAWDRAAAWKGQVCAMLMGERIVALGSLVKEVGFFPELREATAAPLFDALQRWNEEYDSPLPAQRDRERVRWLSARVMSQNLDQSKRREALGDLAFEAKNTLLCEPAAERLEMILQDAESPAFSLRMIAGCYARREDYEQAAAVIDRVRNSSAPGKDSFVAEMTAELAEKKAKNERDPSAVALRLVEAGDCPIAMTQRVVDRVDQNPDVGAFFHRIVQCELDAGRRQEAEQLLTRVEALTIDSKEIWLDKMRQALKQ